MLHRYDYHILSFHFQELRKEIQESFRSISEMRLEPKLLSDQGQHERAYISFVEERGKRVCL